jgi:hypothetical protein
MLSEELAAHLLRIIQDELPYKAAMSFIFVDAFLSSLLRDPFASNNGYLYSRTVRRLTCVIKIERKFDYGLFDFSLVRNATDVRDDRRIVWG